MALTGRPRVSIMETAESCPDSTISFLPRLAGRSQQQGTYNRDPQAHGLSVPGHPIPNHVSAAYTDSICFATSGQANRQAWVLAARDVVSPTARSFSS